jgi:hypothetical protein
MSTDVDDETVAIGVTKAPLSTATPRNSVIIKMNVDSISVIMNVVLYCWQAYNLQESSQTFLRFQNGVTCLFTGPPMNRWRSGRCAACLPALAYDSLRNKCIHTGLCSTAALSRNAYKVIDGTTRPCKAAQTREQGRVVAGKPTVPSF